MRALNFDAYKYALKHTIWNIMHGDFVSISFVKRIKITLE